MSDLRPSCSAVFGRWPTQTIKLMLLLLALCVFGVGTGNAQNSASARIRGTVTDQSDASIPGVAVKLVNTLTGIIQQAETNSTGTYDLPYVPPGTYSVTFSKTGFKELVRAGIVLQVQTVTIDAKLEVGAVTESVTVTAPPPLVQTESSDRSTTLTSSTILELPIVGRNAMNFYTLGSGGSFGLGGNSDTQRASYNGQRPFMISNTFNGAPVNGGANNLTSEHTPPIDSLDEVALVNSNPSAEYGNNGATVFRMITKSGTNQFHGSLFEFVQNDKLSTRNFFTQGDRTPLRWNEFGGTVGGPILRNKAFFFFSYQGSRNKTPSPTYLSVPTADMLAGNFTAAGLNTIYDPLTTCGQYGNAACATDAKGNSIITREAFSNDTIPSDRIDPVAAAVARYWPTPNLAGISNNYYEGARQTVASENQYMIKVDYNLASTNRLSATYLDTHLKNDSGGVYPSGVCPVGTNCIPYTFHEYTAVVTDTWTLGPTMVNEFRASVYPDVITRPAGTVGEGFPEKLGMRNIGVSVFPNFNISGGLSTGLFEGTGGGFYSRGNAYMPASDTFTWINGRHAIKVGGEFDKNQNNVTNPSDGVEEFDFSRTFTVNPASASGTGLGLADFLLGFPSSYALTKGPDLGARQWNLQTFVQDDYKLRPNLTLNLGLRYQIQSGWSEAHKRLADFDPSLTNPATNTLGAIWFAGDNSRYALQKTQYTFFAPRLGFAWSPDKARKYSIRAGYGIYYVPLTGGMYANTSPIGYTTQDSQSVTDQVTPIFALKDGPSAPSRPCGDTGTCSASILNGHSMTYWPHDPGAAYMQEAQLSLQRELKGDMVFDVAYVYSKGVHLVYIRDINQVPESLLASGNAQARRPYPQYQGITTLLQDGSSNYNALQFTLNKRTSHGLILTAHYTISKMLDNSTIDTVQAGTLFQNAADPGSMYGLSTMDVPQRFVASFTYLLPAGSGMRFLNRGKVVDAILGHWQASGIVTVQSGYPFTPVMDTNLSNSLAGSWFPNRVASGKLADPTISKWFDSSAFVEPAEYTFGNSGRDILRGPGYWDADFGLSKSFPIQHLGEHGNLEFKAEAYNIFNHASFNNPNATIGSSAVGTITSASASRNIQLGARLTF